MKDHSDPAFPVPAKVQERCKGMNQSVQFTGMTLRDYFAGKVLQGMVADGVIAEPPTATRLANIATACYVLADAMLAERAK